MIPLTFNIRNSVGLLLWGFSGGSEVRVCLEHGRPRFDPWVGKIPWRRKWQPTPENPMDRGAWQVTVHGIAESDTTERLKLSSLTGCFNGHWGHRGEQRRCLC